MSPRRVFSVLRKDLKMGPRSPIFLYALVFPIVATLLFQVVFGGLFESTPRLGIVDRGDSSIAHAAEELEGIEVTDVRTVRRLKREIEDNNLDGGLVLPEGFDDDVRDGVAPVLEMYYGGESLASNRVVLATTAVGLVRDVAGQPAPLTVEVATIGDEEYLPLGDRLIPLLVMFAMLIAAMFVPASALVEEKENGTLSAMLVTPTRLPEIMSSKGALGLILGVSAGVMTLLLNRAFGDNPLALLVILCVAAVMVMLLGLTVGALVRDSNAMFTVFKTGNIILLAPVIFYIWPDLPQWIPKLLPTYYFLDPVFEVAVRGAGLGDVWKNLTVALGICVMLVPAAVLAGRRMERRLAQA